MDDCRPPDDANLSAPGFQFTHLLSNLPDDRFTGSFRGYRPMHKLKRTDFPWPLGRFDTNTGFTHDNPVPLL